MSGKDGFPKDVRDFRDDPTSTAHAHVRQDVDGIFVVDSRPPDGIATHQSEQAGYDPAKLFDDENAAKHVAGAGLPSGDVIATRADLVQDYIEQAAERADHELDHDLADDD